MGNSIEQRGGLRRPQLSDLRESGAIEQDADLVLFISREETSNPTEENAGLAEIIGFPQIARSASEGFVRRRRHEAASAAIVAQPSIVTATSR
jgi:hypothetical protein